MYEEQIISNLQNDLNISEKQVKTVIDLLQEGCTIPFIARYRKEATHSMTDDQLRVFNEKYNKYLNFYDRLETIMKSIEEQGKLTDEIKLTLLNAKTLSELEDIYRPFKQGKKTRASKAKEKGLEGLATYLLEQDNSKVSLKDEIAKYVPGIIKFHEDNPKEKASGTPEEEALQGAKDIIAEMVSDNADYRKFIRQNTLKKGTILTSRKEKGAEDEKGTFEMYYNKYSEPVSKIPSHRILAINRGEKMDILKVEIVDPSIENIEHIKKKIIKTNSPFLNILEDAIIDGYNRLIKPSIENEIRTDLTDASEATSIEVFKANLKELLLEAPTKNKVVLGFDPGIRTGCKIGIVNQMGTMLYTGVIDATKGDDTHLKQEAIKLVHLIVKYKVDLISLGNGTGGRESERFLKKYVFEAYPQCKVDYVITNEAGASVYSASKLGAKEFPNLDVSVRSAISLARRVQDPLAELVKIDPKSVGVGQYQHDMNQKTLGEALGGVVENCVNLVGVDANMASEELLTYVSGINSSIAANIVAYREKNGGFKRREELKKVAKLGDKAFEQCAGFIRVNESINPLDRTGIHPESYLPTAKLLKKMGLELNDLGSDILTLKLEQIKDRKGLASELGIGEETLNDIIVELEKPGRDIRDLNKKAELKNDVCEIEDLVEGMILNGTVRNIVDFGAFVDIGVHQDGLIHIKELSDKYVKHPLDVVHIGQIVKVKVISVDVKKRRIGLSLKQAEKEN